MNEQLASKLTEILTQIQEATKTGTDWTIEQLPDVASQYIHYSIGIYSFNLLCGIGLYTLAYKVWKKIIKNNFNEDLAILGTLFFVGCVGAGSIFLYVSISQLLLLLLAPKVFLLKTLADFIH